tara:strand:- start:586 stop:1914 length:1329 start_codon:yes stop_codon:yes gene_type:complete
MKFLVVGEVFLDENIVGISDRLSPEAPVPVLYKSKCKKHLGGAANVAKNLSSLGGDVSLLTLLGNDQAGETVKSMLKECNVKLIQTNIFSAVTIRKIRFIANQQHLLRHDIETTVDKNSSNYLADFLYEISNDFDIIVISDYNKGLLQKVKTEKLKSIQGSKPIYVDSKSCTEDLIQGATIYKPNRPELDYICEKSSTKLLDTTKKIEYVMNKYKLTKLLLTLGDKGMILASKEKNEITLESLPVHKKDVYDVTGAGDTVISVLAFCISIGLSVSESSKKANYIASKCVSVLGNYTATQEDLKEANELVIFTNGCFDILHVGHVKLLESCKALGGKVIVGLNSDTSVRKLKGKERPFNNVNARKKILESLKVVDQVIIFEEETPYELIKKIQPDIIVKGGDYQKEDIIGKDIVEGKGGRVEIFPFVGKYSTTLLAQKIKNNE